MISAISGKILEKAATSVVIEWQGLGFTLFVSLRAHERLGEPGDNCQVLTYLHVKDDALELYGFADHEERELFKDLLAVSGIGPRMALLILSGMDPQLIKNCVRRRDSSGLTTISGVGKKLSQRIVVELAPKYGAMEEEMVGVPGGPLVDQDLVAEAVSALTALGYNPSAARRAVERALAKCGEGAVTEELVKTALRHT